MTFEKVEELKKLLLIAKEELRNTSKFKKKDIVLLGCYKVYISDIVVRYDTHCFQYHVKMFGNKPSKRIYRYFVDETELTSIL